MINIKLKINFLTEIKIKPLKLIAMDPPDISPSAVMKRFNDLSDDLKEIYKTYLDNGDQFVLPENIYLLRNEKNIGYTDRNLHKLEIHKNEIITS